VIVAGMVAQGAALALMAATTGFALWALGAALIGVGTALVYAMRGRRAPLLA